MGKRFWFGILLAVLLPLGGFFSVRYLYSSQKPLQKAMETVARYLEKAQPQKAMQMSLQTKENWEACQKTVSALSEHRIPEQIREEFHRLLTQLSASEYDHARETAWVISHLFETLGTAQIPSWWNFF